jgi:hypothetical protein
MDFLIVPIMIVAIALPTGKIHAPVPSDFSRFAKHLGQQISLVDTDGIVREGVLTAATADGVQMDFGGGQKLFPRSDVVSAERLHDGSIDGAIKGAVFGAVMGLLVAPELSEGAFQYGLATTALYGAIGFALDAAQVNRQPIYGVARKVNALGAPKPSRKLSFRF